MALSLVAGLLSLAVLSAPIVDARLSTRIEVSQSWAPKKPEPGNAVTFTVHITNKQTEPMIVTYVGVHMGWQASTAYYETISSMTLTPGQGADFTVSFAVPADAKVGNHDYIIRIDYTVAGTPYSEKTDKVANFAVFEPATDDGGGGGASGDPLMLIMAIGVPVIIVLVLVIVLVKTRSDKHRKRSAVIRARSEPQAAATLPATQEATPGHPEAAVAVTAPSGQVPQGTQGQVQPHAVVHQTTYGVQATTTEAQPQSGTTPMPARPPGTPQGVTPMPSAPPQGRPQATGAAVPMPAKPPTPFGVVRSPKQATPGEDTKAVPVGACGNCGAPVKGRVCTACGARVV